MLRAILSRRQPDGTYPTTGTMERTVVKATSREAILRHARQFTRAFGRVAMVQVEVFSADEFYKTDVIPEYFFVDPWSDHCIKLRRPKPRNH
jgi:hypothetical protein